MVDLALLATLAWLLAGLTWQLVPAPQATAGPTQIRSTQGATPAPQRDHAGEIVKRHLFGVAPAATAPRVEAPVAEAPDTQLNLELRGVLAYNPEASALAIISEGRSNEKVYAIGDQLPGSATLEEVLADHVILKRNGRLEKLRLPEESTPIAVATAAASRGGQADISQLTPGQLRDNIVKDPMLFARKVRTIPHKENGKLVGYKLRARDYEGVLAQYGLQPNDVVTEVNGTALNNPKTSLRALRSLATATEINATVLRDGVEMPIFVSLE
jgi:general secretion pathway protein C